MPNGAAIPAHDRPVFVLAQHRSGGTLLTRLLNCHPALVIWGEHAGILNKLAEFYQVLARHSDLLPERSTAELQRTILAGRLGQTEWRPWNAPFGENEFVSGCRRLVGGLFTPGVGPGQRWGFKEIRYHSPALVGFLRRLFPAAQFILLDRDPVELCVSDMLVSWSLNQLLADGVQHDSQAFERVVEDCLYAILAIWRSLELARALIAGRSIGLRYELLCIAPEPEMQRVFGFLGLEVCAAVSGRLRLVSATVTGATDKAPARSGRRARPADRPAHP